MTLIQRLWLTIILLLVLAFGSSLTISYMALHHHVEETLKLKNIDNVNALALSMSQMDKDPVVLELLIAAQFDTGHYKRIALHSTDGDINITRASDKPIVGAPGWFVALVDLQVPAATATVQGGWRQFGTLQLATQYQFAYGTLWRSARNLFISFVIVALLSLLLAYAIVRGIRQPLHDVIEQARQIGNRQFRIVPEPRIPELRALVKSMNRLSYSVRGMLITETGKLKELQERIRTDKSTGLFNRDHFMSHVDTLLHRKGSPGNGMLALVRIPGLTKLNDSQGYAATNTLVMALSSQLKKIEQSRANTMAARLNGSDFALVVTGDQDTTALAATLAQALAAVVAEQTNVPGLPASITTYSPYHSRSALFATLDTGLARAENNAAGQVEIVDTATVPRLFTSREQLYNALRHALDTGALVFKRYPVIAIDGTPLHDDCPSRLYLADKWRPATTFVPWISRFEMAAAFDLQIVDTALKEVQKSPTPIAINLSVQTLDDPTFVDSLINRLAACEQPDKLLLEWSAAGALANRKAFEAVIDRLTPCGYKIGLKHAGQDPAQIAQLHDLGLDRVQLDASLIHAIHDHPDHQAYVRAQCILLHSLGITVIAAGVHSQAEIDALARLGIDGVTGPGVLPK